MTTLGDLVVFVRVVEARSFSAAARALALPKSTVSRAVTRLEQRLGTRLLQRTTRWVTPTEAGQVCYEYGQRAVEAAQEAEAAVQRIQAVPRGVLRVSSVLAFGLLVLSPRLSDFMIRYPEIRLLLDLTDWPGNLIEEGIDVAICRGPLPESNLVARRLLEVETHLLGSPAYLKAHGGAPTTPADLAQYDLITPAVMTDGVYRCTLHGPSGEEVALTLTPRLGSHNLMLRYQATLAGLGLTWLPLPLCASDLQAGRLQQVLPGWSESRFSLYSVYPHRRGLAPKVRVFIDFLAEQMEALEAVVADLTSA